MGSSECFDRPNLHFTKSLTTELGFTTQGLLRDEGVRTDRTRVHLIIYKVTKFQHVRDAYRYWLIEFFTGQSIVEVSPSEFRKMRVFQFLLNVFQGSSIEDWSRILLFQLQTSPSEHGFIDLAKVHTRRYAQRVKTDIDRSSILKERHVLFPYDPGYHTFVTVATGHLISDFQFAFFRNIHFSQLDNTRRQFITNLKCKSLAFEFTRVVVVLRQVVLHRKGNKIICVLITRPVLEAYVGNQIH